MIKSLIAYLDGIDIEAESVCMWLGLTWVTLFVSELFNSFRVSVVVLLDWFLVSLAWLS